MYHNPRGHQAGCKRHPDIRTHLVPEFSHNGMGSHTRCHTSGRRHTAIFGMAEFILVEFWPEPNLRIDHMGKPFPTSHLCGYVQYVCGDRERESNSMCAVVMS